MHSSVQTAFRAFNEPFEGVVHWMYLDVRGLVTVGVGNLIEPVELALKLPFHHRAEPSRAATAGEIAAEWRRVKSATSLAHAGWRACEAVTTLGLDDHAIDALISSCLDANEALLTKKSSFQAFDVWPADAQLGLLSMSWALGVQGLERFSMFSAACRSGDFLGAAANCLIREGANPGVAPRNRANRVLFRNAATVRSAGIDPARLYYPVSL